MNRAGTDLSIRDVTVAFGAVTVLDRVSLELAAGETVAVLGPSGSGKSTLLRAVAGLEPLVAGEIRAGGRSLAGVPVSGRDLGLMFQDGALFPHLDVAANVAFGLRMKGWPPERQRARVAELLDLVGLADLGGRAVHELSGGEAQRVALARALAPEPALLMLDEPFGSLDRVLREQLTTEVRRLLRELGQTALHVTHDQGEAFALADRVAVLSAGRLVQVGAPAGVWRRPADEFVARFLGHPNLWPADLRADGRVVAAGIELVGAGAAVGAPVGAGAGGGAGAVAARAGEAGGGVVAVVPVTALRVDQGGRLSVVVSDVEFRQGRYRVRATLPAGVATGGRVVPVEFDTDRAPDRGAVLTLDVDERQVWLVGQPVSEDRSLGIAPQVTLG